MDDLKANADKALYAAKEAGRDRAMAMGSPSLSSGEDLHKSEMPTIARKNRIISNVIKALDERDSFLIVGHKNPDEDCVSAMVSFGLLASKLNKKAAIALSGPVPDNYRFLLNICQYNSIHVLDGSTAPPSGYSTLVIVDTAKPEMIDRLEAYQGLFRDPSVLKIEIDHHLEADASYSGDPGHRLVMGASSSCEIVGLIAFKMYREKALMERYQIAELFTRNIVLSILSGIIGDSRMGKYLKTRREKWFYAWFSALFERMLAEKTRSGSGNFSSKEQVFDALASLSENEKACFDFLASHERSVGRVRLAVLDSCDSGLFFSKFGSETAVAVSKAVVDRFAESGGYLGLVAYFDAPGNSDFVQFRLRRSQAFTRLDLREVISRLGIANGGGHPGAVGFRIPKAEVPDIAATVNGFASQIESMIG
jgi:nanoRNase/pAp phosphatase (c-di-AMP/oligoRNAs hydrolase)